MYTLLIDIYKSPLLDLPDLVELAIVKKTRMEANLSQDTKPPIIPPVCYHLKTSNPPAPSPQWAYGTTVAFSTAFGLNNKICHSQTLILITSNMAFTIPLKYTA